VRLVAILPYLFVPYWYGSTDTSRAPTYCQEQHEQLRAQLVGNGLLWVCMQRPTTKCGVIQLYKWENKR